MTWFRRLADRGQDPGSQVLEIAGVLDQNVKLGFGSTRKRILRFGPERDGLQLLGTPDPVPDLQVLGMRVS